MTNIDPDARYERVNDITAVSIRLASPTDIRNWSYGEVRKPETINYRTYRPEKDGLFCERIFGPKNDYECFCGKYKGIKHKGIVCDRCGVEGHPLRACVARAWATSTLAAPVAHIWFFKAMPSRLGDLLGMKTSDLEKVIYFQDYVVIDPGNADQTKLEQRQMLTEDEYRGLRGARSLRVRRREWAPRRSRAVSSSMDLEVASKVSSAKNSSETQSEAEAARISSSACKIVEATSSVRATAPSGWSWT
jgi:DNA-directed RNA polymerase subunit beta'